MERDIHKTEPKCLSCFLFYPTSDAKHTYTVTMLRSFSELSEYCDVLRCSEMCQW